MMAVVLNGLKLPARPETLSLLKRAGAFFARQNIQTYIVGGFVRDLLLKRDTADIDIALEADALEIAPKLAIALGGKYIELDEVNRVGRVVIASKEDPLNIVMWQLDLSTAQGGILEDLKRRDFTINAMAIGLEKIIQLKTPTDELLSNKALLATQLTDPYNGLNDLRQGVIKSVSEKAFRADALRLLRAVRLASELSFTINRQTEALIRRHSHLIVGVASERIREELLKILAAPETEQFLLYLDDLGLLTALIPELALLKGTEQPRKHTWDVFNHSVKTVAAVDFVLRQGDWQYADGQILKLIPWSVELSDYFNQKVSSGSTRRLLLKLAALLHDIAKPQTKSIDEWGKTHFFNHPGEGAPIATRILEKLRFSSKEVKLTADIVRYHLRPVQMSQSELPSSRAIYRYFRDTGEAAIDALFISLADHLATRGPDLDMANWQEHANIVAHVLSQRSEQEGVDTPSKLIDGHDLINHFNLTPGPELGKLLETVHEAQVSGEVPNKEKALSYVKDLLTLREKTTEDLPYEKKGL
ncbi:MAG: HD domain-containing protein [Dehalococcoidales bacterium]|jgi:poly(A) polymerase|nr:HD domain-containing protein [Dehalococcoidales bacterium]